MTSTPRSTLRWALRIGRPLALVILVGGVPLGCYKPHIKDGGLRCNLDAAVGNPCPEGFRCDMSIATPTCWRNLDGGVDRPFDAGDGGAVDMHVDGLIEKPTTVCFDARPNCTATDAAVCDPFCQSGCGCLEKCSVNTGGAATCNTLAPGQVRGVQQPCEVLSSGTATQTDQCAQGLVCVDDACGDGTNGRCYQFCRSDNDCTDAPCNRDAGGGFRYCDVPFVACTPLPGTKNTGCPGQGLICYIATSDVSREICDCQFPPGSIGDGDVCTFSRDCNPGLACVANQLGIKVCTRVCRLNGTDCPVGTCRTLTENGKTNLTFGVCGL